MFNPKARQFSPMVPVVPLAYSKVARHASARAAQHGAKLRSSYGKGSWAKCPVTKVSICKRLSFSRSQNAKHLIPKGHLRAGVGRRRVCPEEAGSRELSGPLCPCQARLLRKAVEQQFQATYGPNHPVSPQREGIFAPFLTVQASSDGNPGSIIPWFVVDMGDRSLWGNTPCICQVDSSGGQMSCWFAGMCLSQFPPINSDFSGPL